MKLDYTLIADALASARAISPSIFSALINAESAWNPKAVSSTGCAGLGQFSKGTAREYGLMGNGFDNRMDAALNMTAMALYLADMKKEYPKWRTVIGHYSGQGDELKLYARYGAGRALIAAIDAEDVAAQQSLSAS